MQKHEGSITLTNTSSLNQLLSRLVYLIVPLAVLITFFAIFALDEWAEASAWHHATQHGLIFTSGAIAGVSLLAKRNDKKGAK